MIRYIFICGNLYPHQIGGLEVFNRYLIEELGKSAEVAVVSHQKRPQDIPENSFLRIPTLPPHGLYFSIGIIYRFLFSKMDGMRMVVSFSKAHWINWLPYILLKKLRNLKYIVVIHSGDTGSWSDKTIHRALLKNAHSLFGVSESICNSYERRLEKPVSFLPPLIPFEKELADKSVCRNQLGIDQERKVILMVGSLRTVKNPEIALAALGLLGKEFLRKERIFLVFVGGGELQNELEAIIQKLGIQEFVRLAGIQPREKIPMYLKASDLYLITSEHEGKPLSLLEALLYPIEIIGSDADGVKSILYGFGGNVFERGNARALAELLKTVLTDPTYKPKHESANAYFFKTFDYQKVLKTFVKMSK